MCRYSESATSHGGIHYEPAMENLLRSSHLFPYRGSAAFLETYYRALDQFPREPNAPDFLVFTDVDAKQFDEDFQNSSNKLIRSSISLYDPAKRALLAKMPTAAHAQAGGLFEMYLSRAIQPQSLCQTLTAYKNQLFHGQCQGKEADNAWGPLDRTPHQDQRWPTVAWEVAVSETRVKLEADISFWLTRTFGQVKMVIAAEVARTRHQRILLEKWILDGNGQPHCAQRITLRKTSLQDRTPIVENGPLTIDFDSLFLRPPQPGEHDVVLDDATLGIVAKSLWMATE